MHGRNGAVDLADLMQADRSHHTPFLRESRRRRLAPAMQRLPWPRIGGRLQKRSCTANCGGTLFISRIFVNRLTNDDQSVDQVGPGGYGCCISRADRGPWEGM